ncbi:MAG: hypothetical protein ACI3XQ_13130, partial [Eubacteriales bacterium]
MKHMEIKEIWRSDEHYERYRIPGMLVTAAGTLLVYTEARRGADDWSMMDVLMKRSEDGGKTFGKATALARGTKDHPTVNNPVTV